MSIYKTFQTILENSREGESLGIKFANISAMYVSDTLYAVIDISEDADEGKLLWIKIDKPVLDNFLGRDAADAFLTSLRKAKGQIAISKETYFFKNVNIDGNIADFNLPLKHAEKTKGIIAVHIEKNILNNEWQKGALFLEGENERFLQLNDRLKKRLSGALIPYVNTPVFSYLANELSKKFGDNSDSEIELIECEKCGNSDVYHVFELINGLCEIGRCRKCGTTKYKSLIEVPFGKPFLIALYSDLNDLLENYGQKNIEPPAELIKRIMPYSTLEHRLEDGVTYDYLRNRMKLNFDKERYSLMQVLQRNVDNAKRKKEKFDNLLNYRDKITSMQSLQTTRDTSRAYRDIELKLQRQLEKYFFPHPLIKIAEDEIVSRIRF